MKIAIGISIPPEHKDNKTSRYDFLSEFIELENQSTKSKIMFLKKWKFEHILGSVKFVNTLFDELYFKYNKIIKSLLKINDDEIDQSDLDQVNKILKNIQAKLILPKNDSLKDCNKIYVFTKNGKLNCKVINVKKTGHPDKDKSAKIDFTILPKTTNKGAIEYDLKIVTPDLLNELLNDNIYSDYTDQFIVEKNIISIAPDIKKSKINNTIKLGSEKEILKTIPITDIYAGYNYERNLENTLVSKIYSLFSSNNDHRIPNICEVCGKPSSRMDSKHCGAPNCKKIIKSRKNKKSYKSHL